MEKKIPEHIYHNALWTRNLSLKQLIGLDIHIYGDMETVKFFRIYDDGKRKSISLNIPYYNKFHPEKMVATSFNMFTVFEYTKQDAYTTQEIDWYTYKEKFIECLTKICKN